MNMAQFFVSGALACALCLLQFPTAYGRPDVPQRAGRYLLVEIDNAAVVKPVCEERSCIVYPRGSESCDNPEFGNMIKDCKASGGRLLYVPGVKTCKCPPFENDTALRNWPPGNYKKRPKKPSIDRNTTLVTIPQPCNPRHPQCPVEQVCCRHKDKKYYFCMDRHPRRKLFGFCPRDWVPPTPSYATAPDCVDRGMACKHIMKEDIKKMCTEKDIRKLCPKLCNLCPGPTCLKEDQLCNSPIPPLPTRPCCKGLKCEIHGPSRIGTCVAKGPTCLKEDQRCSPLSWPRRDCCEGLTCENPSLPLPSLLGKCVAKPTLRPLPPVIVTPGPDDDDYGSKEEK